MSFNHNSTWEEQASAPATPATGLWKIYPKADGWYTVDDAGTEYPLFQTTTEMSLLASSGWPSTTGGCAALAKTEYTTNDQDLQVLAFDQTTAEYAQWSVWMPEDWDLGTITFKAMWSAAGGSAAETVSWNLQGRSYANDNAIDAAWGTAIEVTDALLATGDVHITDESAAVTPAGGTGRLLQLRIYRNPTNDNLAADALLIGIKVYYTRG